MAEVLLFHHIQGLTDGVTAFADDLRAGGHTVHIPDLFDGQTFASIEEGFATPSPRTTAHRRASPPRWRGCRATWCTPASPTASRALQRLARSGPVPRGW